MLRRGIITAVIAMAALGSPTAAFAQAAFTTPVLAQSSDPFMALVGKRTRRSREQAAQVEIERYVLASDDRAFLFEDHSNVARIVFLCGPDDRRLDCTIDPEGAAPEIYLLTPTRGPRGDTFYKNAEDDTLLRMASYGGATVFWPGEFQGYAASKSFGENLPLRLMFADFETAQRRAQAATAVISALTGAPIVFDIGLPPAGEGAASTVLADAVIRTATGIKNVAEDPTGARIIASRITRVDFRRAEYASVELDDGILVIGFVPNQDIEGRPSSATIARYLEDSL